MSNVIDLGVVTTIDSDPNRIIDHAQKAGLTSVVIVGLRDDGSEYFASSYADGPSALWDLERAKHKLLSIADD